MSKSGGAKYSKFSLLFRKEALAEEDTLTRRGKKVPEEEASKKSQPLKEEEEEEEASCESSYTQSIPWRGRWAV